MAGSEGVSIRSDRGKKERELFSLVCAFRILYHVCLMFHARSAYYVHETEEIYTATQINLAKLTREPSATYQMRLLSQRGTEVNRPHTMVTSCCVHHYGSEIDTINSNSSGRRRVLCTHSSRSTTSAQTCLLYTSPSPRDA